VNVFDLHCDLLLYLALDPKRTPLDPQSRCSLLQQKEGNVTHQTLAIFSETQPQSSLLGQRELEIFHQLKKDHPEHHFFPAFENASAFSEENEPLETTFQRLSKILEEITPLYISLTWNEENRFGGNCASKMGLKEDGEELLKFLSGKKIAIDLSHASDLLAREIIHCIDVNGLDLRVLASHSNFRSIHSHVRNLPDDIAKEICARDGLIGLVLYSKFLKSPKQLYEHIEHGYKLGGERALAFGADFFCREDLPHLGANSGFHPETSDSSQYPSILRNIQKEMGLSQEQLEAIASKNALTFINQIICNNCN